MSGIQTWMLSGGKVARQIVRGTRMFGAQSVRMLWVGNVRNMVWTERLLAEELKVWGSRSPGAQGQRGLKAEQLGTDMIRAEGLRGSMMGLIGRRLDELAGEAFRSSGSHPLGPAAPQHIRRMRGELKSTLPSRKQVLLNSKIGKCQNAEGLIDCFMWAKNQNIKLSVVNMSTAISRLVKLKGSNPITPSEQALLNVLVKALDKQISEKRSEFRSREIATVLWSLAKLNPEGALDGQAVHLFHEFEKYLLEIGFGDFEPVALSLTTWAYAASKQGSIELFDRLEDHLAKADLAAFNSQGLSNLAWAFATVGHKGEKIFPLIEAEMISVDSLGASCLDAPHVSGTAPGQAPRLEEDREKGMHEGGHFVHRPWRLKLLKLRVRIREFNVQGIINIMWAFAKSGHYHPEQTPRMFNEVSEELSRRGLGDFDMHALATLAAAYANGYDENHQTLNLIEQEVLKRGLTAMDSLAVAVIARSFAVANCRADNFFSELDRWIQKAGNQIFHHFRPTQFGILIAAIAKSSIGFTLKQSMITALINDFERLPSLEEYTCHSLCNVVWACATINMRADSLLHKVADSINRRMDEMTPFDWTSTLTSFASLQHDATSKVEVWIRESVSGTPGLQSWESSLLATLYYAVIISNSADKDSLTFIETIEEEIVRRDLFTFSTKDLTLVAWAHIAGDRSNQEFLLSITSHLCPLIPTCSRESLNRLSLVLYASTSKQERLDSELAKSLHMAVESLKPSAPKPSAFHRKVAETLLSMKVKYVDEYPVFNRAYWIDIVIFDEGRPTIALEVDGPIHFMRGFADYSDRLRSGPLQKLATKLKRRLLEKEGWIVVSVPYFEWDQNEDKKEYLTRKLKAAVLRDKLVNMGFSL